MRKRMVYFLAGVPGCNERMLAQAGLLDRFLAGGTLGDWCVRAVELGPSGASGCLVVAGQHPPEYEPSRQVWLQGGAKWWVGLEDRQQQPGPNDLVREVGLDGYEVELGDGQHWRVPRLLRWDSEKLEHVEAIPKRMTYVAGASGGIKIGYEIPEAFRGVVSIARQAWDDHVHERPISVEELFKRAADLLSCNYKLGPAEAALLGLLDEDAAVRMLAMSFDLPAIMQHAKEMRTQGLMECSPTPAADAMEVPRG